MPRPVPRRGAAGAGAAGARRRHRAVLAAVFAANGGEERDVTRLRLGPGLAA